MALFSSPGPNHASIRLKRGLMLKVWRIVWALTVWTTVRQGAISRLFALCLAVLRAPPMSQSSAKGGLVVRSRVHRVDFRYELHSPKPLRICAALLADSRVRRVHLRCALPGRLPAAQIKDHQGKVSCAVTLSCAVTAGQMGQMHSCLCPLQEELESQPGFSKKGEWPASAARPVAHAHEY